MEFSVIIPTYMEAGYIENCLQSISRQKYKRTEFEIIVSDSRSSDKTVEIASRFADIVIVDDRRGISYGRNAGAKEASGNILVFVDADAILAPDFLSYCHQEFSNLSVVGITGIAKPNDGGILQRFIYTGTYCMVYLFHFFGLSLFPGICVAYRSKVFTEVGGFREDFGIVEDLDLSRRISKMGITKIIHQARAFVSTRRLERHLVATVAYHIYSDLRYLLIGKAHRHYPKNEETHSWKDLWKTS